MYVMEDITECKERITEMSRNSRERSQIGFDAPSETLDEILTDNVREARPPASELLSSVFFAA